MKIMTQVSKETTEAIISLGKSLGIERFTDGDKILLGCHIDDGDLSKEPEYIMLEFGTNMSDPCACWRNDPRRRWSATPEHKQDKSCGQRGLEPD
ncbi:MAG: hypothetical protein WC710_14570 [Gallionella sp.]|jgi:hypothetical protein